MMVLVVLMVDQALGKGRDCQGEYHLDHCPASAHFIASLRMLLEHWNRIFPADVKSSLGNRNNTWDALTLSVFGWEGRTRLPVY